MSTHFQKHLLFFLAIISLSVCSCSDDFKISKGDELRLNQNENGSWGKNEKDVVATAEVICFFENYKINVEYGNAYTLILDTLMNEIKWEKSKEIDLQKPDIKVITHYRNILACLFALLPKGDEKDSLFVSGVEKLISEQQENGSFYNQILFTSQAIPLLNSYYYLKKSEKTLNAIKKAHNYLKAEIEKSNYDTLLLGLYSYALMDTTIYNDKENINRLIEQYFYGEFTPDKFSYYYNVLYFMLKTDYLDKSMKFTLAQRIMKNKTFIESIKNSKIRRTRKIVDYAKLLMEAKCYLEKEEKTEAENIIAHIIEWLKKNQFKDGSWANGPSHVPSFQVSTYNTASLFKISRTTADQKKYLNSAEKGMEWISEPLKNKSEYVNVNNISAAYLLSQVFYEADKSVKLNDDYKELYQNILNKSNNNWVVGNDNYTACFMINIISNSIGIIPRDETIISKAKKAVNLLTESWNENSGWQVTMNNPRGGKATMDITDEVCFTLYKVQISGIEKKYEPFLVNGINHLLKTISWKTMSKNDRIPDDNSIKKLAYINIILKDLKLSGINASPKKIEKLLKKYLKEKNNAKENLFTYSLVLYSVL